MYDLPNGTPRPTTNLRPRAPSSSGASGQAASSRDVSELVRALQRAGAWVDATLLA